MPDTLDWTVTVLLENVVCAIALTIFTSLSSTTRFLRAQPNKYFGSNILLERQQHARLPDLCLVMMNYEGAKVTRWSLCIHPLATQPQHQGP